MAKPSASLCFRSIIAGVRVRTAFFNRHASRFFTPEFLRGTASCSAAERIENPTRNISDEPLLNQMLYVDIKTWLPDDLLVKADKTHHGQLFGASSAAP